MLCTTPCHVLHFTLISARGITKCRLPLSGLSRSLFSGVWNAHGRVPGALSSPRARTHTLPPDEGCGGTRAPPVPFEEAGSRCRSWNTERALDNRLSISRLPRMRSSNLTSARHAPATRAELDNVRSNSSARVPPDDGTSASARLRKRERTSVPRVYVDHRGFCCCCSAASATHSLDSVGRSPRVPLGRFVRVSRATDGFRLTRKLRIPLRSDFATFGMVTGDPGNTRVDFDLGGGDDVISNFATRTRKISFQCHELFQK